MDRETIRRITSDWYETAQEEGHSTEGYQFLGLCLPHLVDSEAELALAKRDGVPAIVALAKKRLLVITVTDPGSEGPEPALEVQTVALIPDIGLHLHVSLEHRAPRASFLARTWTLVSAAGDSLSLKTQLPLGNFASHYVGGDQLMVTASGLLGWPMSVKDLDIGG